MQGQGNACGIGRCLWHLSCQSYPSKGLDPKVNHKEALEMATVGFFASQMLFLTPNQQCKWTEGAKAD